MTTVEREEEIGNIISYQLSEGDVITIDTRESSEIHLRVSEVCRDEPLNVGDEQEVLCDVINEEDTVGLYAQLTKLQDMESGYDLYALRFPVDVSSPEIDLGQITQITVK